VHEIAELLLALGSDPNQPVHNDYTPLHRAAGANAALRTRIDDLKTPLEVASKAGHDQIVKILERT
jgi:ankyrin repeat protein